MTHASVVFLALAAVTAILDWRAVARRLSTLEYIAKPAATAALLATLATLDVPHDSSWAWRLAALALCIVGDVFLMLPRDAFVPGLASFAVAQVMFTVSFATGDPRPWRFVLGIVIVLPATVFLARRFIGALRKAGHGDLVMPVAAYMVVISAMAISAVAAGSIVAIAGAAFFMMSDSLIAESRFVHARRWHPVGIMVTYHLALAGLVVGLF